MLSLRLMGSCLDKVIGDVTQQISLVNILGNLAASEEYLPSRCLACVCLGVTMSTFYSSIPPKIRRNGFKIILVEFLKIFPSSSKKLRDIATFDLRSVITKQKFDARIQLLFALSHCFKFPEASNQMFMRYIDEVLVSILNANAHVLLSSAVLQLLAKNLPKTVRNRIRIETFYRRSVDNLISVHMDGESSTRPSIVHLMNSISLFMSVWYPMQTDKTILFCKSATGDAVDFHGYAEKRYNYLSQLDQGDTIFEELSQTERIELIKKAYIDPYIISSSGPFEFSINSVFDELPEIESKVKLFKDVYKKSLADLQKNPSANKLTLGAEDEDVIKTIFVPPKDALTFKLSNPTLEFSSTSIMQKLFLENTTAEDQYFVIQISNIAYFHACPSFGIVPKLSSTPIKINFRRNLLASSGPVKSYMYVRTKSGFPLERINLSAINLPALKVSTTVLDFGICPPSDARIATLCLTNLLPIEIPVIMVLSPGENSSRFILPQAQILIAPNDAKHINIKGLFLREGPISEELVLVAYGGQLIRIKMVAFCGRSLKVLEESINFGPTDIFFDPIVKKITLINMNKDKGLPITWNCSTNELVVNNGENLILEPGETRVVPIKFLSILSGKRNEKVFIYAPNSPVKILGVHAISGPNLKVPVHSDIYMTPSIVGETTFIRLPLSNLTPEALGFEVTVPVKFPIKMVACNFIYSNAIENKGYESFQSRETNLHDSQGLFVNLPALSTAVIEIGFSGILEGFFKVPLDVQVKMPKKIDVGTYHLHCFFYNDVLLKKLINVDGPLKDFCRKPYLLPLTKESDFSEAKDVGPSKQSHTPILQLDPPLKTIFGARGSGRLRSSLEFVNLINLSSETQKYRIVLSHHFVTTAPTEGTLAATSTLQIPIRFDPQFLTNSETNGYTAFGFISVLDSHANEPGITSSQLLGIIDDLVAMEVRDIQTPIKFPDVGTSEAARRQILCRNKSSTKILVELRVESSDAKVQIAKGNAFLNEAFVGTPKTFQLKPFEVFQIEVALKSSNHGSYSSNMSLTYVNESQGPNPLKVTDHYNIGPLNFIGNVLFHEISRQPEFISFGDLNIGEISQQSLIVQNHGASTPSFLLWSPPNIRIPESLVSFAKGKPRTEVAIEFIPSIPKYFQTQLSFVVGNISQSIPILGTGGYFSLASNIGKPFLLDGAGNFPPTPPNESCLDLGQVALGDSLKRNITINNFGTLDAVISKIHSQNEALLQLEPLYPQFVGSLPEAINLSFGSDNLNNEEIDLDNFIYMIDTANKTVANRTKVSQFYKRRASSIVTADRKASKLFNRGGTFSDLSQESVTYGGFPFTELFPCRIRPFQRLDFSYKFNADTIGNFCIPLTIKLNRFRRDPVFYSLWIKGTVIRPLVLDTKRIDFGLCPVAKHQLSSIVFTNEEKIPIPWSLKHLSTKHLPIEDVFDPSSEKYLNEAHCPVYIYPESGVLIPGATQEVDLRFTPSIPHTEIYSLLSLKSGDYNVQDVLIQCTSSSSELVVDHAFLDFGTLRVGAKKTLPITLKNLGLIPCSYFLENSNHQYSGDPEIEIVPGSGEVEARISFKPTKPAQSHSIIRIHTIPETLKDPIEIKVYGAGGYPKLVITAKVIDFGTALYKAVNKRRLEIQNIGAADAEIVFECNHTDISIENSSLSALLVQPGQTKNLMIVYQPQTVEKLNVRAFIRSSDNRGETFTLNIKGDVGIPKLSIHPRDALESLNFGVMRLNKIYKKAFTIINDGTIFLSFKSTIDLVNVSQLTGNERKKLNNVPCPITVVPTEGRLGLGESMEIEVSFLPNILAEYEYEFKLSYEYQHFTAIIKGVGGRSAPKILSPFETFDFELCRLNRLYEKTIQIFNQGNLGFYYHIRPKPVDGDMSVYSKEMVLIEEGEKFDFKRDVSGEKWFQDLKKMGITVFKPDGYCGPQSKMEILIHFRPDQELAIDQEFLFFHDEKYDTFRITGVASTARLYLYDPHTKRKIENTDTPDISIGVHPVNVTYKYNMDLVNPGPFGIDFLMQPMSSMEYDIFPLRGYIEPKTTVPICVAFRPSSESKFSSNIRVLWEAESIKANIFGDGGIGRLEIKFLEERDILLKSLDFGMVPFNTPCRKRFYLSNFGMVGVNAVLETENEDYAISLVGDAVQTKEIGAHKTTRETFSSWTTTLKVNLAPGKSIQIGVRYLPRNSTTSVGNITIRSDSGNFSLPLKGKGGTISLSHKGDLDFGDISCNYIYTRKITIANGGSIPANLKSYWLVVGYANEKLSSSLSLSENYGSLDPRSQWARNHYCTVKGIDQNTQLNARDHWNLILIMISKEAIAKKKEEAVDELPLNKRKVESASSNHFKRRQMFYFLITSTQLSSQSALKVQPYIKVTPPVLGLQSYGEATLTVELNLGSEDTFLATLVIKPDIPNSTKYEIPLTATPKVVNIFCDDTRILNFYRQPMGETESIMRTFTNLGHKDIPFKFINGNSSLSIIPSKGILKIGESITATFMFTPVDESSQSGEVVFDPLFSHPIRFKMYGGGGYAKASLSRYRRFDFGHCMIGKDTVSFLPIVNEGNALLHLIRFDLQETNTFYRGKGWPTSRISLFPGKSYNLPLVFNPHEENPSPGSLNISTISETFEIELIGLGREAVLIVSKVALEFSECLIGNTYEQKVGLKNIGDVNYPVTCHLEKEFPDIQFSPPVLTINPFSENFVTVTYTPSHQTKSTIVLTLSSPYSTHKVPIMVHAGIAQLEFSQTELDFGMFERTTKPSMVMTMRNTGTVKTNFLIKDSVKPSIFSIEPYKGIVHPKKSVDVKVYHIKHEVSHFDEKLSIRTDLVDKIYHMRVTGRCEETVLHSNEFSLLNLGVCPVLEPTTKPIQFKNYGKFPLRFQIQSAYPLKVTPTEGMVDGEGTGTIHVTWSPSGGYELRTQLMLITNIGKYQILVRGKSMFPDITVSTNQLDFGVCAAGFPYSQYFIIENRGKVKLNFVIPPCKEPSYVSAISQGTLEPKESKRVDLLFTPRLLGKLPGSFIVDVKGIHYKEVLMSGIGGTLDLGIDPLAIDLERCPYGLKVFDSIKVVNNGDVTVFLDFSETPVDQGVLVLELPKIQTVYPKQSVTIPIGFSVFTIDRFYAKLRMDTKEQSYIIPITGVGVKITLSKRSKAILASENISTLQILDPMYIEPEYLPVEYMIKRHYDAHLIAMKIYDLLAVIFGQEMLIREAHTAEDEMVPTTQKRLSFVNFDNIEQFSPEFKQAVGYSNSPSSRASLAVDDALRPFGRSSHSSLSGRKSATSNSSVNKVKEENEEEEEIPEGPSSMGRRQLPSIGSLATTPKAEPVLVPLDPLETETGERIYTPPAKIEIDSGIEDKVTIKEPEEQEKVSIQELMEKEKLLQNDDEDDTSQVNNGSQEFIREKIDPEMADPLANFSISGLENSYRGAEVVLSKINEVYNPFSSVDYKKIEVLADQFVQLKSKPSSRALVATNDPPDADKYIIQTVLDVGGKFTIKDTDLDPVLYQAHDTFEPINLDFITNRPPPFKKEEELKLKTKFSNIDSDARKGYLNAFPRIERNQRNAHSNPFSDSKGSNLKYGKGIRLYTNLG